MNVGLLYGLIFAIIVIFGLGIGGFYWFYIKSRTKKITYNAKIWEVTGEMSALRDTEGKIISSLPLKVLKPFGQDVIERVELAHAITSYRLIRLNRPVPEITADVIQYWGKDNKDVHVLKDGDNFTTMRMGLDTQNNLVFQPLPYDLSNMLLNQMAIKEEKFKKEKDTLAAITPWIVTGILMIGLVISAYFVGQGWIESSKNNLAATEKQADASIQLGQDLTRIATATGIAIQKAETNHPVGEQAKTG